MSEPSRFVARTAAALATRRRNTQAALGRVRDTIARLRREKAPITVAVVAPAPAFRGPFFAPIRKRKPQSRKPSGRPATNSTDLLSRLTTHANQPGVSGPSMPRTHSRPPARRFCFNATALANCSARFATWKPNGHAMTSSESPPRTPRLNSGSVSSSPTIARSTNDSKPPLQPALPTPSNRRPRSPTD
jgi:hypothetical protein